MTDFRRVTSGDALAAVGVLHVSFGLARYRRTLGDIARDGLVDSVEDDPAREAAFWFLTCGASLILTGLLARWTQRQTGALPASTAPMLLGIGTAGVALMPRSGFWALLVPAVLAYVARERRRTDGDRSSVTRWRGPGRDTRRHAR